MKCLKWIVAVTFSVLSINTFATDVTGETIMDSYIGAGNSNDVNGSKHVYDIDKMVVDRTISGGVTTLSIDIFTSFYNNNYQYSANGNRIRLGDLFMAADDSLNDKNISPWDPTGPAQYGSDRFTNSNSSSNTGTNWNYAYDLSGQRKNVYSELGQLKTNFGSNQVISSSDWHGSYAREDQAVMLADSNSDTKVGSKSRWDLHHNNVSYTKNGINYGKLSLSFDVSSTALATANQIAFRWAMTCANDIIEGVATFASNKPGSSTVPEPATILLMLLALVGITYRRKVNQ
jgi:hypothetical protein